MVYYIHIILIFHSSFLACNSMSSTIPHKMAKSSTAIVISLSVHIYCICVSPYSSSSLPCPCRRFPTTTVFVLSIPYIGAGPASACYISCLLGHTWGESIYGLNLSCILPVIICCLCTSLLPSNFSSNIYLD